MGRKIMQTMRAQAEGYLRAARGGLGRPEKFNAQSLFQLTALAVEGFWLAWLTERDAVPSHHAFRDLVRAAETLGPLPADLKKQVLVLDQYQKLCDWIPLEPRQPEMEDIAGLLETAARVAAFTVLANEAKEVAS
jgi:hypothetical protein